MGFLADLIWGNRQADRDEESLELQRQQLDLQRQQYMENLRSNYYSYMQQLSGMEGDYKQNQLSINQTRENIASNQNYLDRWASEYDQSMQSSIDEAFNTYMSLASNYTSGLVTAGESGHKGGSSARVNASNAMDLQAVNGRTDRFTLQGNRLGASIQSSALDMLADKQTAISSVATGYQSIDSYKEAMASLESSMSEMRATTEDIKKQLDEYEAEQARKAAEAEKTVEPVEEPPAEPVETYDDDDNDEVVTHEETTAERDNRRGKELTEKTKESEEYQHQLALMNSRQADEKGKSQTEYYKNQIAENQKKAEEEANKAKEQADKVTTGQSDYWKEQLDKDKEDTEEKTTATEESDTKTSTTTNTNTEKSLDELVNEIKADKNKKNKKGVSK